MNNYFNFVKTIKSISLANGLVNETGEGDIYTHLNSGVHKYPCVFLTVENIVNTTNDTMRINGTLFYVDRLCDNEANKVEVQSNGITILQQIIDKISEETVWTLTANVFTPFTEKFADLCAGQFVSFTVDMPNEIVCSSSEYEIKTIELTKNGLYDITGYDKALVNVITKWGDIEGNIEEQTDLINYIDSHTTPAEWGNITGNIENQTDLNDKLTDLDTRIGDVEDAVSNIEPFTPSTIVPTTTNFVPDTDYTIHESLQRTANLFGGVQNEIDDINAKVPAQASSQNQLADKNFVNSTVATNAANFRGNWVTWNDVPTVANNYPVDYAGNRTPTNNDYMVVQDARGYVNPSIINIPAIRVVTKSTSGTGAAITVTDLSTSEAIDIVYNAAYSEIKLFDYDLYVIYNSYIISWQVYSKNSSFSINNIIYNPSDRYSWMYNVTKNFIVLISNLDGQWRFMYVGDWDTLGKSGWQAQYKVGSSFTAAQQAALDSNITAQKVATYDGYGNSISALQTDKVDKVYTANKIYATDAQGQQTALGLGTGLGIDNGNINVDIASIKTPIIINYGDTSWTYDKVMEKISAGYVVIVYYAPYNEFYYCYKYTETIITFYNNLNLLFQDTKLYRLRYCQLHKNNGWQGIYVFTLQGELPAIPDVVEYGEDTYQETLRKLNDIATSKVVYCRKKIDSGDNTYKVIFGVPQFNLDDGDVMYGNLQFTAIDSDTNKLIIMEVDENDNWETTEVTFQYKLNAGNGITINQNSNTISCNAATNQQAGIAKLYNSFSSAQDGGITPYGVSRALQSYQPLLANTGHIHISKNTSGGLAARFVDKERPIIVGRAIPCKIKKYFTNDGLLTDAGKLAFSYLSGSRYLVSGNMLKIVCDNEGFADEIYEFIRAEYPTIDVCRSNKTTPTTYTSLIRVKINSNKMPIVRMPFFNYETTTVTSYIDVIKKIILDICENTDTYGYVRWAKKESLNFDKTASPYVTVSQGIIQYNKPIHVYKPQSRTMMDNRYTNLVPPLNIVRALYNLPNYTQHSRMLCCDVNSNIDYQTLQDANLWFALYRKFDIRILRKKIHKNLRTEGTVTYSKSFIRPGGSSVSGNKLNALASRTQHSGLWRIALKWKRNKCKISSQAIRLTLRVDINEIDTRLLYKCNLVS